MPPEGLIGTVHAVFAGEYMINGKSYSEEELEEWIQRRIDRYGQRAGDEASGSHGLLSPREMEILELICQGASNKDISQRLGISYQTVKNHVTAILQKLRVNDRTQAVLYALKHGWFSLESTN
jgi:DNA-binding NarL/FixJ family response regulator